MTLNELRDWAHANSRSKGFHDKTRDIAEDVALIHSEASELLEDARDGHPPTSTWYEAKRKDVASRTTVIQCFETQERVDGKPTRKPSGIPSEIADVLIRCFDFAGLHGIDLDAAVAEKMEYNSTRPVRHNKKF